MNISRGSRAQPTKQTKQFLIYGATGFTGKLTVRAAVRRGLKPILAGRNERKLERIAGSLGLQYRVFSLCEQDKLDAALTEVDAVLHIAGPFSATCKPMADACVRTRTHYLDITGEIDVFEALAARDREAKSAGIMLLPGVGFDVVPSDCLAAHLKRRLPDAIDLKIEIGGLNSLSHGTMKAMVEALPKGARVRRDGRILTEHRPRQTSCDFGDGPIRTLVLPWGDVSTAYYSTGIPNVEVRMAVTPPLRLAAVLPAFARKLAGTPFAQRVLKAQIGRMPEGPSDEVLRTGRRVLVGIATNAKGQTARARVTTGQGNVLTAQVAVELARRVLAGDKKPGFQTPSLAYGPDLILQFEGTRREDLNN
jgi:short subunit dehydrogenase-like uncharacterized protein